MTTISQALDRANPIELADLLREIQLGTLLTNLYAALTPRTVARTGLTSQAAHVHSVAGSITAVADSAGTTNLLIVTGAPGAGEVQVNYDSAGLATLTFSGAVTGYQVNQTGVPTAISTTLAETWGGAI